MKAKHTPGPWTLRCARLFGPKTRPVADIYYYSDGDDAESEANARLIAAAPELLAACHSALEALQAFAAAETVSRLVTLKANLRGPASILPQLQAALAKAAGQ